MGNLRSVQRAWQAVGAHAELVDAPPALAQADALVFPGQGAIVDTMTRLQATGWDRVIRDWIAADRPFFGICLGLQALFEHSEEGDTPCLGIFPGQVKRFRFPPETHLKVPHMGWNTVHWQQATSVEALLPPVPAEIDGPQFYFVHSYYAAPEEEGLIWGETDYGGQRFCAALRRGNCYATQYHPEKSQANGLALYRGFLATL